MVKKSSLYPRTYSNGPRATLSELNGRRDHQQHPQQQPMYASTMSLRSLAGSDLSTVCTTSLRNLDYSSSSLIDLQDQVELERLSRKRSPSLPPIHTRNDYRYQVRYHSCVKFLHNFCKWYLSLTATHKVLYTLDTRAYETSTPILNVRSVYHLKTLF